MLTRALKTVVRTLCDFGGEIINNVIVPGLQIKLQNRFPLLEQPFSERGVSRLAFHRHLSSKNVDGAVLEGADSRAWAKYAIKNGLPTEENQRVLAIENVPHTLDDFDGIITEGYGQGRKSLVYGGVGTVKIGGRTVLAKINYHEHDARRAGLHYDLVVEGINPGTEQFEFMIPAGLAKGRYAVVRTLFGEKKTTIPMPLPDLPELSLGSRKIALRDKKLQIMELPNRMILRMKDRGIVLPKPDYKLKDKTWLSTLNREDWILERKYDGTLANVKIERNRAYFRSHRETGETYVDLLPAVESLANRSRFASLRAVCPGPRLDGSIFKGELVHPEGVSKVSGIVNSLPQKAQEYQRLHGPAEFYAWDLVRYRGRDLSALPYAERRALLESVIAEVRLFNEHWNIVEKAPDHVDPVQFFEYVIGSPLPWGEGVIAKSKADPSGTTWYKVKRFDLVDLVVVGYLEGTGKYKDSLGAVLVENPSTGAQGKVGSFSLTDAQRQWIWAHRDVLSGQVARIHTMNLTDKGIPRTGVFDSWHPDKSDVANQMYLETQ